MFRLLFLPFLFTLRSVIASPANKPGGTLHRRDYFYVGQKYIPSSAINLANSTMADGQMYVEHLVPSKVTQRFPILIIHGHGVFNSF